MGTINSIICAIISALFTVFFAHMSRRKTRVTIYCMENTLLTQRPNVPGLAVFVKYEDMTPIENLWRICYMLKNTGNQNIVGEGIQSSLVTKGHGLPLYTRNIKQIIQISATDNSIAELKDKPYILNNGCRMNVSPLKLWWKAQVRNLNCTLISGILLMPKLLLKTISISDLLLF